MPFVTYQDVLEQLVDYLGGNPTDVVLRDARRAVLEAYRDYAQAHRWTYLLAHGRVVTSAPYREGTVAYDPATRRALLSDGAWPAWAAAGYIRVGFQAWKVASRLDDVTVMLDEQVNPGAAVDFVLRPLFGATNAAPIVVAAPAHGLADGDRVVIEGVHGNTAADGTWAVTVPDADHLALAGSDGTASGSYATMTGTWRRVPETSYVLYRDGYVLPDDFIAQDQALYERNFGGMDYVHPREWLFEERFLFAEGTPRWFTVMGDRNYPGRLVLKLVPFPTEVKTIDFLYQRRPRPLAIASESAGRATVAAAGDVAVAGAGTAFTAAMVGSVLRLGLTATRPPTAAVGGFTGVVPAVHESVVAAVASATALTLADPSPQPLAGVQYTISDPIDVEPGAMLNGFYRCCEFHLSLNRTLKDKPSARAAYVSALGEARAADSRTFAGRSAGQHGPYRQRLRDMPIHFNEMG